MEPNADSLILKILRDLPAYGIKLRDIGRRACAAACDKNDPDPLPRSKYFAHELTEAVRLRQRPEAGRVPSPAPR